ncbi:telomerase Cajal body protein 1 [Planococcus citri]|uniref:telomerase Cajal body protein 1 n=1 Tax=Planococcus citri TaxID=170843 RepID=UPI0031F79488
MVSDDPSSATNGMANQENNISHRTPYSENCNSFPTFERLEESNTRENLSGELPMEIITSNSQDAFISAPVLCEVYEHDQFFKGCKWSPDDLSNRILTCDGGNKLRIFHTFLNRMDFVSSQISDDFCELSNIGKIYDFDWYPIVSPSQYYVLVASSLGPIHMWDLRTSKSEASYQMYSTKDEAVHAHCVTSSLDGQEIYAATSDYIFHFDANRPGRTYDFVSTRSHFRRAIISTIALNPIRNSMFAVGTYNNRIGIYDEAQLLCMLYGHTKGITYLKFSPNGTFLFSGVRGEKEIICWDLRNPGTALYKLNRAVKTQQRIYFDLTADGKYIVSGSTNGDILVWNTLLPPVDDTLEPICTFKAHEDCANGISINKQVPIIATVSGQYHDNESSRLFYDSEDEYQPVDYPKIENSLKLWHVKW